MDRDGIGEGLYRVAHKVRAVHFYPDSVVAFLKVREELFQAKHLLASPDALEYFFVVWAAVLVDDHLHPVDVGLFGAEAGVPEELHRVGLPVVQQVSGSMIAKGKNVAVGIYVVVKGGQVRKTKNILSNCLIDYLFAPDRSVARL